MIVYPRLAAFFINERSTIENAIKVINDNGKGICLVVDNNHNLKGLLTDGDIRRLLLKGSRLFDKISNKYNKKFFYIKKNNIHKVNLQEIKKKFSHVPILKKRKIISLLLKDDLQIEKKSNYIFILAGGLGSRMGNLTKNLTKPMLKINKKSIF